MGEHPLEVWRRAEAKRRKSPLPAYVLAKEIGCSRSRYYQLVTDRRAPSSALAKRIKARTGISIDEILEAAQ